MNRLTKHFFHARSKLFTFSDAAVALGRSSQSRHGLIKRAIAAGDILKLRRGLYCLAPKYQQHRIDTYAISQHLYGPSYISFESALSYHGWIPEAVYTCTNACMKPSKELTTPLGMFSYKRVLQKTLYLGVEQCRDQQGNQFFMASPAKALADYVYIHKPNWKTIYDVINSLRIDIEDLNSVQPAELMALAANDTIGRVRTFLDLWERSLQA